MLVHVDGSSTICPSIVRASSKTGLRIVANFSHTDQNSRARLHILEMWAADSQRACVSLPDLSIDNLITISSIGNQNRRLYSFLCHNPVHPSFLMQGNPTVNGGVWKPYRLLLHDLRGKIAPKSNVELRDIHPYLDHAGVLRTVRYLMVP